jgi:hypothetical protein
MRQLLGGRQPQLTRRANFVLGLLCDVATAYLILQAAYLCLGAITTYRTFVTIPILTSNPLIIAVPFTKFETVHYAAL